MENDFTKGWKQDGNSWRRDAISVDLVGFCVRNSGKVVADENGDPLIFKDSSSARKACDVGDLPGVTAQQEKP